MNGYDPRIDGLTQVDLNFLLDYPLEEGSPLGFNENLPAAAVRDLPFIRLCRQFLSDLRDLQPMKATQKGNLPRKFVQRLYDYRIYTSEYIDDGRYRSMNEEDFMPIHLSHILLNYAGAIKKRSNKLSLTRKGEKLLADEGALYRSLLEVYTSKYNWAYGTYGAEHVAQYGWGLLLYRFLRDGDQERDSQYYADFYRRAFPLMVHQLRDDPYSDPVKDIARYVDSRFFRGLCGYFGLAEIEVGEWRFTPSGELRVRRSALAELVFQV